MDRRQFIKGAALSLGSIGIGAIATRQFSQSVKASVEASDFSLDGDSITTRDGEISSLSVSVNASWSYELPSGKSPNTWTVALLTHRDGKTATVDKTTGDAMYLTSSGDVELSGSVLETELYQASDFDSTTEGETLVSKIPFSLLFTVENSDGEIVAQATNQDRGKLSVTNEAYNASEHGELSGSGSLNVSG